MIFRNAVKQEQVLIQDSAGFSSDLLQLVSDVRENKLHCQKLVDKVETLTENTQRDGDRSLQIRETQISGKIVIEILNGPVTMTSKHGSHR